MADQYSGEMLIELERKVEKIVPRPDRCLGGISVTDGDTIFNIGPEVDLDLFRQAMLSSGREGTFSPEFKAAMVNLIDRVKSDNPSPADVIAAWAAVLQLWPRDIEGGINGCQATAIHG